MLFGSAKPTHKILIFIGIDDTPFGDSGGNHLNTPTVSVQEKRGYMYCSECLGFKYTNCIGSRKHSYQADIL